MRKLEVNPNRKSPLRNIFGSARSVKSGPQEPALSPPIQTLPSVWMKPAMAVNQRTP